MQDLQHEHAQSLPPTLDPVTGLPSSVEIWSSTSSSTLVSTAGAGAGAGVGTGVDAVGSGFLGANELTLFVRHVVHPNPLFGCGQASGLRPPSAYP